MVYNPRIHHRRSIRLKGYDYGSPGAYFVTLNCINRLPLFGKIRNGEMFRNEFGEIAFKEWYRTSNLRPHVKLGAFIVMPDHLHGIFIILEHERSPLPIGKFISPSDTLGAFIRGYMASVTSQINELRQTPGEKVWQLNYWDHIIRNEKEFHKISNYILNNPKNWKG